MCYGSLPHRLPVTLCFSHIPSRISPPFAGGSPPSRLSVLYSGWLLHDVSNLKFDRSKLKTTCSNWFQMFSVSIVLVSKIYPNIMIKFKAFESGGFLFKSWCGHNRESIRVVDECAGTPSENCWSALETGTKPPNTALQWPGDSFLQMPLQASTPSLWPRRRCSRQEGAKKLLVFILM